MRKSHLYALPPLAFSFVLLAPFGATHATVCQGELMETCQQADGKKKCNKRYKLADDGTYRQCLKVGVNCAVSKPTCTPPSTN
jgi:hypothetical protein